MKPQTDYESLTKNQLITEITHHELIDCYDSYDYHIENPEQPYTQKEISYLTCNLCLFSDYVGSTVERSNQRELYHLFEDQPGVTEECLGYSGIQTVFTYSRLKSWKKPNLITLLETLDNLTNYPLINDEDLSNLENEVLLESWDNYISSDILTNISKLLEIEANSSYSLMDQQRLYNLSEDLNEFHLFVIDRLTHNNYNYHHEENLYNLFDLYHVYQDETADYPIYEAATSAYVDTEKVAKWMYDHITQYIFKPESQKDITEYL